MDFDFRAEYSQRSDEELLTIVTSPHRYQAVAASIAEAILSERGIDLAIAHAAAEQSASGSTKTAFTARMLRKIEAKFHAEPVATVLDEPVIEPAGAQRAMGLYGCACFIRAAFRNTPFVCRDARTLDGSVRIF